MGPACSPRLYVPEMLNLKPSEMEIDPMSSGSKPGQIRNKCLSVKELT